MNPTELSQNIISSMAKGHAYDQAVLRQQIEQRDQRIKELEHQVGELVNQIAAAAAKAPPAPAE